MLFVYYIMIGQNAKSNNTSQTFKEKTIVLDFYRVQLKKSFQTYCYPLRGETTDQTGSQDFSILFKKQYKDKKVISVGWQENPDLEKIVELEPDLILMTGERQDLYEDLSEIAPTVGYLQQHK